MNQTYKSKISWWLFGSVFGLLLGFLVVGIWQSAWLAVAILGAVELFLLRLFTNTYYRLTPDMLYIVCGWPQQPIPVASIKRVAPSNSPASSPALSFDRLEISYNKYDSVLISPADKAGFLVALQQLNPAIQISLP
ncbi:PH domain-containing protein [Hymenobacter sp. BT186]|uniref:PH domain-containing protein n=1 Tax=Hymenobacter telluris TaxID=2816474 RepID=A0A939EXL3_9BACT|nr:PH domain-containing protein [Hymenobacter telluris]MBO0359370.1 PH domain-containing protein [Hymenobacter telluris]MBW3375396.1 PH domain-containing protein [Hymenobacter norwichensis]